jgi:hypothetical protein
VKRTTAAAGDDYDQALGCEEIAGVKRGVDIHLVVFVE